MLGEEERAQQFEQLLWVDTAKGVLDTPAFSLILQNRFKASGMSPLGVRQWRQASVAIADAWLKRYEGMMSKLDEQRGHSTRTCNLLYGGNSGHRIDREAEWEFVMTSKETQDFWGVSHFPLPGLLILHLSWL